jgi:septal ring factor EnvC (AmiA/AmiB activator)
VIDGKMRAQEEKAQEERVLIGALARRLYRQRAGRSTFEILVSHDSFSSFFDDIREIVKLETAVHKALGEVRSIQEALVHDRETRSQKQAAVTERQRDLEVIKVQLQDDHDFKTALLSQTQDSELDYRYRLAELKSQQNDADSEITYLEKVLRDKLALSDRIRSDGAVLSWPVSPGRGVSTRFHDPDYPFRYVFERAKDAGFGYSYVLLIHNNSISTVYGHLSKIAVKEDTYVERGEIIGYSGGMPGTAGAGPLTTGPHLHFETRYGGIPVDPMKYLASF